MSIMTWGDIANIFNSNNVLFKMGRVAGTDPVEELIMIETFRMTKNMPIDRTSSRDGPVEVPDYVLREFLINANMTKDLYDQLEKISEPTSRGGFVFENFELDAESIADSTKDSKLVCNGYVRNLQLNAVKGTKYNVDFIIRPTNNSVVIS